MAIPRSKEARLFYRCALQRLEEVQILLRADRTTGAVYLAGYGIECILKALILSVVPSNKTRSILRSFQGRRAHDYEWLRGQYYKNRGAQFPRDINQHFILVSDWSTTLRYAPGNMRTDDAEDFVKAVDAIIAWAEERF